MSTAGGDGEHIMGIEHAQLEQATSSLSLEDHVLQMAPTHDS